MRTRRQQQRYDFAWIELVRADLAEGLTPAEIGERIRQKAEWYIGLSWLLEGTEGGEYELIRAKHPKPVAA